MSLHTNLGGSFTLPGSDLTLKRMGYGAMPPFLAAFIDAWVLLIEINR